MNHAKKTIQNSKKDKKKQLAVHNPKIWIIPTIVIMVFLIGAILFDQFYKSTVLTIEDDKYYMDDLNYYFYTVESQYAYFDQLFGGSYWDMTYDQSTGTTVRDIAKTEAMNYALENEVMYREAVANGYSLTTDEVTTVATKVDKLLTEELTEKIINHNNFTEKYLTDILSKTTLGERYRADIIATLDVNEDEIEEEISFEEYRQYKIEYLYASTQTTDSDGKQVNMSEEEKSAIYDNISSLYDKAVETEDWSTLIPEEESEIVYRKDSFTQKDTYIPELKSIMLEMDNNAISDIVETENGFFIVRMLNNSSTEAYDKAVNDAITTAENAAFDKYYEETILPKYKYKINDKALAQFTMGNLTLVN